LSEHDLAPAAWRQILILIEDRLDQYWQKQQDGARDQREFWPLIQQHYRTLIAASHLVRARLPISMNDEQERALVDDLTQHEARWRTQLAAMTPRGRPADAELSWFALSVVAALDRAGVPLDVGRKTAVVEVLALVRGWAHRQPARHPRSYDYEFSRLIVETYRTNPHA
jgi:hypothetical protein